LGGSADPGLWRADLCRPPCRSEACPARLSGRSCAHHRANCRDSWRSRCPGCLTRVCSVPGCARSESLLSTLHGALGMASTSARASPGTWRGANPGFHAMVSRWAGPMPVMELASTDGDAIGHAISDAIVAADPAGRPSGRTTSNRVPGIRPGQSHARYRRMPGTGARLFRVARPAWAHGLAEVVRRWSARSWLDRDRAEGLHLKAKG
jgi:hypothetical protein